MTLFEFVRKRIAIGNDAIRTPCYVYAPEVALTNHEELCHALGTPVVTSLKANSNPELLSHVRPALSAAGFEVASPRELNLLAGDSSLPVYLNTPAMSSRLMQAGIDTKSRLVLDNAQQVDMLLNSPVRANVLPVLLRANASVTTELAPGGIVPRTDQFGMDWSDLLAQADRLRDAAVEVAGIHLFAGSNSFAGQALRTVRAAGPMIRELEARLGYPLAIMNLGGGFQSQWRDDVDLIRRYRAAMGALPKHVLYIHEAGRAIFASAGVFVTQVIAQKFIGDNQLFVCDGGLAHNFLICGTENRLRKRTAPLVVTSTRPASTEGGIVVGNTCCQDDVLGLILAGAGDPTVGDFLLFADCGAYHATYPNNGFLGFTPAGTYVTS